MGSSGSYDSYRGRSDLYSGYARTYEPPKRSSSFDDRSDEERRREAEEERLEREKVERERTAAGAAHKREVEESRKRLRDNPNPPPPPKSRIAAEEVKYDRSLVRLGISKPDDQVQGLVYLLIDNSASNDIIRTHVRNTVSYILGTMGAICPGYQVVFDFVSDHYDGSGHMQEIDYVYPTEDGVNGLVSSIAHVHDMDGGDYPECFACPLDRISRLDFGNVPKEKRHVIVVTDSIPHGFGYRGDDECTAGLDWGTVMQKVQETFATFQVIGCAKEDQRVIRRLQRKMIPGEARIRYDLMDLSTVKSEEHRKALVTNAILFFMARNRGRQTVEGFLAGWYAKMLREPIFGQQTDHNAQNVIAMMVEFIEASREDLDALLDRILVREVEKK